MFTGIIEEVGQISAITETNIKIKANIILDDLKIGDSIAVNGVCLTVINFDNQYFTANVSQETYRVTTLSKLKIHDNVNLERAMPSNGRFGGHIVSGHIDTLGNVVSIKQNSEFYDFTVKIPSQYTQYTVKKGSIAINGISLTIADIDKDLLKCAIIPHTFNNTTLKDLKINDNVNLEFDIFAKYVEKILSTKNNSNISLEFLQENGFV